MADVPATEEIVAAEFAIGGAAASFCGQWLCVKAGFEKKGGVGYYGGTREGDLHFAHAAIKKCLQNAHRKQQKRTHSQGQNPHLRSNDWAAREASVEKSFFCN